MEEVTEVEEGFGDVVSDDVRDIPMESSSFCSK